MRRKQPKLEWDMGGGFYIHRERRGSWWEYSASHLDAPGGYVKDHRLFHSCYRREAEAKIAEWRASDMDKSTAQ